MSNSNIHHFLDCLSDAYQNGAKNNTALKPDFDARIEALKNRGEASNAFPPEETPVCRFMGEALKTATENPTLINSIKNIQADLHWVHKYAVDDTVPNFSKNYAHSEIMGPNGLIHSDKCKLGFVLMAPDLYYPYHRHIGVELYLILSGTSNWKMGEDDYITRKTGDYIYHPSNIDHAMQTLNKPVLALYSLHGDIISPVAFSEGELTGVMYPEHMK